MVKNDSLRKFIWLELAIWLIIASLLVISIRSQRMKHLKSQVTYQIFMPDVDGLIVGSPVKFMGVEIGYVSQIKIVGRDVYLKLLITEKDVKLPQGVIATTEFSGLGGSKSLELYPPTPESLASNKIIDVQSPTRLRDVFVLLNDMFKKIDSIAQRASFFGTETETLHPKSSNNLQFGAMQNNVNMVNIWLDTLNNKLGIFNKKNERGADDEPDND
ncbi:MCE family protein [bacterium]|nr:MCE family protein [bacterium]